MTTTICIYILIYVRVYTEVNEELKIKLVKFFIKNESSISKAHLWIITIENMGSRLKIGPALGSIIFFFQNSPIFWYLGIHFVMLYCHIASTILVQNDVIPYELIFIQILKNVCDNYCK